MLARLDTPESQAAWDAWRAEARRQAAGDGPVRRREPKSAEPPLLVLLRDYWAVCTAAVVVFGGGLMWLVGYFFRGALTTIDHHEHGPTSADQRG